MKKQKGVVFALLLAAVFMASTAYYAVMAEKYRRHIDYSNQRAYSDLVSSLSEMNSSLSKLRYANTPQIFDTLSANIWKCSQSATDALSEMSLGEGGLQNTQKFVAQAGDFSYYLLFTSAGGGEIDPEHLAALDSLYAASEKVSGEVSKFKNHLNTGQLSYGGITKGVQDSATVVSTSMGGVEQEFPQYATLIYDGPFSEHLSRQTPKLLEGLQEVDQGTAANNAAWFAGVPVTSLNLLYEGGDKIKCFCFSTSDGVTIEVSKIGGLIYSYKNPKSPSSSKLSVEEAIAKAQAFLAEKGYDSMSESYYITFQNVVTINFAYSQNDILVYPDLIKVGVSLEDGSIISLEGRGYIMCHTSRTLPRPTVSAEAGRAKVKSDLTIESVNLALVPTSGQNEVLCHEYVCTNKDGQHVIVYINAQTGQEQNIYLLIEDENGILAI